MFSSHASCNSSPFNSTACAHAHALFLRRCIEMHGSRPAPRIITMIVHRPCHKTVLWLTALIGQHLLPLTGDRFALLPVQPLADLPGGQAPWRGKLALLGVLDHSHPVRAGHCPRIHWSAQGHHHCSQRLPLLRVKPGQLPHQGTEGKQRKPPSCKRPGSSSSYACWLTHG